MKITAFVKRSILVWGVSCLILPAVGYAQKTDFERFKMPSGLRVLVHQDDRAPVVSVALMYKTGRNDEPSSLEGMNRVVAGMRTEASPHLSVGQYREIMDAYGGKSTIRVDPDVTLFCDSFSSNMLKGASWLAADKAYGFRDCPWGGVWKVGSGRRCTIWCARPISGWCRKWRLWTAG